MRALWSAEIIAVGSELLTPTRIDTNSLAITDTLNRLGIDVRAKAIVGDRRGDLAAVFRGALARADLVVLCGGLGPTDDDLTRDVVADVLERPLHEDAAITETIRARFARRNLTMPDLNRRQAMVPDGGSVLANVNGTAPGLWIEHADQVVMLLPGPPRELGPMLEGDVRQRLLTRVSGEGLFTRVVRIFGRSESHTEEAVRPFYAPWAAGSPAIEVTILAARGAIDLHLTVRARDQAFASAVLDPAVRQAAAALGDDVYSDTGRAIEQVTGDLLRERGWHLAAAESCTGGLLLSRLTDVPGSSDYVACGIVSYSNQSKVELLGVDPALIDAHGAVSEPVAQAMAAGIRARGGADVGIAITGIAGPGGGTETKPVGTVAIALDTPAGALVRTRRMPGGRDLIREMAVHAALDTLRRLLTGRQVP
ncbi:MAG: competence/damage-inducible protein A [Vicinamibacteria bacterium]|nr:competence/damage-inducible protein A [Vicinamibacteria bacterium]